jgi:hypothetical protein
MAVFGGQNNTSSFDADQHKHCPLSTTAQPKHLREASHPPEALAWIEILQPLPKWLLGPAGGEHTQFNGQRWRCIRLQGRAHCHLYLAVAQGTLRSW